MFRLKNHLHSRYDKHGDSSEIQNLLDLMQHLLLSIESLTKERRIILLFLERKIKRNS